MIIIESHQVSVKSPKLTGKFKFVGFVSTKLNLQAYLQHLEIRTFGLAGWTRTLTVGRARCIMFNFKLQSLALAT